MIEPRPGAAAANPFSSRYVRPGALPYRFAPGESSAQLVDRLAGAGWQAQIVGPHGSGKSTMLIALLETIEAAGRKPIHLALHDRERRLPFDLRRATSAAKACLIVDGFEQLGLVEKYRVSATCRLRGWGLLVTVHRPLRLPGLRLPVLARTCATLRLADELVAELLQACATDERLRIDCSDVAERFAACDGNLRDVLWELYDLYESRREAAARPVSTG